MDSTTAPSTAMRTATTAPETIDFMAFRSPAIACDGLFLSRRAAFGRRDRFQVGDEILAILRRRHALQRHLAARRVGVGAKRSEEHTSELQSLMRISYAVFCLKKKNTQHQTTHTILH